MNVMAQIQNPIHVLFSDGRARNNLYKGPAVKTFTRSRHQRYSISSPDSISVSKKRICPNIIFILIKLISLSFKSTIRNFLMKLSILVSKYQMVILCGVNAVNYDNNFVNSYLLSSLMPIDQVSLTCKFFFLQTYT